MILQKTCCKCKTNLKKALGKFFLSYKELQVILWEIEEAAQWSTSSASSAQLHDCLSAQALFECLSAKAPKCPSA